MIARTPSKERPFFFRVKNRRLIYLLLICLFALGDFLYFGIARRTLVFYSNIGGKMVVEDRMLQRSDDREMDIQRYVNEVLLGPASPRSDLLFPRETRLASFMFRDGIVYANLTEHAALPINIGEGVYRSFLTLDEGIRRNFSYVKDVRFFIGGNEVFF